MKLVNLKKPDNEFSQLVDETLSVERIPVESTRPQLVSMENFKLPEEEDENLTLQFYYLKGHTKVGPFTQSEISELIAKKELIYTDFISTNEGKSWCKVFENPYFDRRQVSREDLPLNPSDDSFLHSNLEVLAKLNNQANHTEDSTQDILAGFAYSHTKNVLEKQKKAATIMHPIHAVKKEKIVSEDQTKTVRLAQPLEMSEPSVATNSDFQNSGLVGHVKKIILHIKVLKFYFMMATTLSISLATIAVKTYNDSKVSDLHPDTHSPPSRIKKRLLKALEATKPAHAINVVTEQVNKVASPPPSVPKKREQVRVEPVAPSEMGQRDDNYDDSDPYEQDPVRRRLEPQTVNPTEIRSRIQNNANELDENLRNPADSSLKEEFIDQ